MLSIQRIVHSASLLALTRPSSAFTSSPTYARATTRLFSTPPTRYLLSYDYIPDVLEKRGPYREGHLGLAKEMIEAGSCVSGGPSMVPRESVPSGGECISILIITFDYLRSQLMNTERLYSSSILHIQCL